jgi:hypothetical protein
MNDHSGSRRLLFRVKRANPACLGNRELNMGERAKAMHPNASCLQQRIGVGRRSA